MVENAPILVLLCPLFAAVLGALLGQWKRNLVLPVAVFGLTSSLYVSVELLMQVMNTGVVEYRVGGWTPPWGIHLVVDGINAFVVVLIQAVALLALIHSYRAVLDDVGPKRRIYYPLYLLFVAGISGISMTGDAFNLYVLIEVSALTSYALLSLGARRSVHSAFNYLILGAIGASFYLLGIGYLYLKTGTLNMIDLRQSIMMDGLMESPSVHVAFVLIMLGVWMKMALFPVHGWLPNAYAYSPPTSASLIAPLMTKVMVYVMIRMMLSVFGPLYIFEYLDWSNAVVYLAIAAILAGSLMALGQRNYRKMLAYIVVAEVGYMVGGAWVAGQTAMVGAIYHILSDSAMTLCLFLVAGAIFHKTNAFRNEDFEGLFRKMPVTMGVFVMGALSMVGIPPTAGFFSKWYLIGGAFETGDWLFAFALIVSSLINAVLFFRIFEYGLLGVKPAEGHGHDSHSHQPVKIDEAPLTMLIPMCIAAACVILLGVYSGEIVMIIDATVSHLNTGGALR